MARGFFFVGTDHNIGTTMLTGAIAGTLRDLGSNTGVFKPIAMNSNTVVIDDKKICESVQYLKSLSSSEDDINLINPYSFEMHNIPVIAARFGNDTEISIEKLDDIYFRLSLLREIICIDGGAGLLSPITKDETMVDLLLTFNSELVIVTTPSRMMVPDLLLSAYFAMQTGIPITGYIINGWYEEAATVIDYEQIEIVKNHVGINLIGMLPRFEDVDFKKTENFSRLKDEVKKRFDLDAFRENRNDWL